MKLSMLLWFGLLLFQPPCSAQLFGTIDAASGSATLTDASGTSAPVVVGQRIFRGQTISTETNAEVHAITEDGGLVALRPNTLFRVLEFRAPGDTPGEIAVSLLKGAMRSITGLIGKKNPENYRVVTSTATIGIRGTDHETTVVEIDSGRDRSGTFDSVNEGATVIRTALGELRVEAGQHGFAPTDGSVAPQLLERQPEFLANRALRIEERIAERKELLIRRIQQLLQEGGIRPGAVMERLENATEEQRETIRKNLRRRLQQRKAN